MKIIQDHKGCIGCGACAAVCPKFWEIGDDGKAKPKGAKDGIYEIKVKDAGCNKDAAEVCPVGIIKIT